MIKHEPFSVSMCVYGKDNPDWFRTAVDSILNQTVKADEIVLVVDGPVPEKLDEVISQYEKLDDFRAIRLPENVGHGNARRTGLEQCKHNLVALMDADDISVSDRFEKQLMLFNDNPELAIAGGNIEEFIDTIENVAGRRIVPSTDLELKEYIKKRCPFNQMTVMFKKDAIESVGGYLDWYCNEDYYLWLRMYLSNMQFANLQDILVHARVGEDMYRRRGGWKYFKSEYRLQKYMLNEKVIGVGTYTINVVKRFIVQVLLPNSLRGIVFKRFARD